jgi:hypothetical protein
MMMGKLRALAFPELDGYEQGDWNADSQDFMLNV